MTTVTNWTLAHILSGIRQQDGFAKGRAISIANTRARLAPATAAVRISIDRDKIVGNSEYGRATRISRKLRASYRPDLSPAAHRRWTARILARLMKENS